MNSNPNLQHPQTDKKLEISQPKVELDHFIYKRNEGQFWIQPFPRKSLTKPHPYTAFEGFY